MALDDAIAMAANWSQKMLLEALRASAVDWVRRTLSL